MPEFSHADFIDNWNQVADLLCESGTFQQLPELNTHGTCTGLSFMLAEFVKRGEEALFYKLCQKICNTSPLILACQIENSKTQDNTDIIDLIDFIYKIHIFQKKQNQYNYDETEKNQPKRYGKYANYARVYTFAPNHDRLGEALNEPDKESSDFSIIRNHEFNELSPLIDKLDNNESYAVSIFNQDKGKDPDEFHCILVYKYNNEYHVYDSNASNKVTCKDSKEAAAEVTACANRLFTNYTDKYTVLDKCREKSNFFKIISTLLFPITLFWMFYDQCIATPLTQKQLKEKPLSNSLWLSWGKVKKTKASKESSTRTIKAKTCLANTKEHKSETLTPTHTSSLSAFLSTATPVSSAASDKDKINENYISYGA